MSFFKTCLVIAAMAIFVIACSSSKKSSNYSYVYKPQSQALFDTIAHLDSVFFSAYNSCNIDVQAAMYSDTMEFYHDKGGLMTDKAQILADTKKYVCGNKVSRELVKGSIEVYSINNYGAVEMGLHRFHNGMENSTSDPSKFIIFWQNTNNKWTIRKVVSLH
ncbi:nuclear transport factor 2 family protein [Chitinophagaceae bacterium 26-R-25]|nr:nuclear transport factor 2 family protein [Chitinophagaceae bacterium 26-R-25]